MKKEKIAVAMSGGIDSSVSALLLKKQGYAVTGFFMKFWSEQACGKGRENSCCDSESLKKAKEIAKKIGIPFHVIDAQKIFKKTVVDYFISGYRNLETPNPCVVCNQFIKFGWFLDFAQELGFQKIATGHYVRIKKDKNNIYHLLQGEDGTKDQSYFLCRLSQKQLSKIIFPVGNMTKVEVKKIAGENNLSFENKKESQEICFIKNESYREFLKRQISGKYFRPGNILDAKKKKIGEHQGLLNYTIGQRKGIEQTGEKNENRKPSYVISLEKKGNNLIVGDEKEILKKSLKLKKIHWISETARKKALKKGKIEVKIRYRSAPVCCRIKLNEKNKKEAEIEFIKSQRAITPGQFAVFYAKEEALGSGVICS
jgi:tRNA-uridine 2-sulfurtransferase